MDDPKWGIKSKQENGQKVDTRFGKCEVNKTQHCFQFYYTTWRFSFNYFSEKLVKRLVSLF